MVGLKLMKRKIDFNRKLRRNGTATATQAPADDVDEREYLPKTEIKCITSATVGKWLQPNLESITAVERIKGGGPFCKQFWWGLEAAGSRSKGAIKRNLRSILGKKSSNVNECDGKSRALRDERGASRRQTNQDWNATLKEISNVELETLFWKCLSARFDRNRTRRTSAICLRMRFKSTLKKLEIIIKELKANKADSSLRGCTIGRTCRVLPGRRKKQNDDLVRNPTAALSRVRATRAKCERVMKIFTQTKKHCQQKTLWTRARRELPR